MDRRSFLRSSVVAGSTLLAAPLINRGRCRLSAAEQKEYSVRALDLVQRSLVIDMLGLLTMDWPKLERWQRIPGSFSEEDFQKLKQSGIDIFHPAVEPNAPEAYSATLQWTRDWNYFLENHAQYFLRIDGIECMEAARSKGRIGILLGFQNSAHFRTIEDVGQFYRLGQRVSQLTYNSSNLIGHGCIEREDTGLTDFGVEVVQAMNRFGMAIDVSHTGERTTLDAFSVSNKPVIITHSNCKALVPKHPRCKSDEVIKRMAADGSVMGITAIRNFIREQQPVTIHHLLDHFDHVVKLVGVEHVGLGTDMDADVDPKTNKVRTQFDIRGLRPDRRVYDIAEGLIQRGYGDRDIELMLGGNFRRVLGEIWDVEEPALTGPDHTELS